MCQGYADDDPEHIIALLEQVIALSEEGVLPVVAGKWADGPLSTTMDIQETIDSMQSDGKDAPTENQSRALKNIHAAALRWLNIVIPTSQ